MCGIAGKICWNSHPAANSVVKMCEKMIHRGPDDYGIVSLQHAVLGHRRLSIIDLSQKARQPMVSSDQRYFIVYNGEVYNFRELRKDLEGFGVIFKSDSDTEVVLYSFIHWGPGCLDKFNGMFSFAIWDNVSNSLFLTRDRFGKKPLYYFMNSQGLVFASELNALICDQDVPTHLSYEALNCFLALGYILSPMSVYKDICKLEPATYLSISDSGKNIRKVRYWDYADKFKAKSTYNENETAAKLNELLELSVKRRMVSDVPIAAFLSGGIDSSSVVRLLKKLHQGPLHTFSIGFDQPEYSEIEDARRAAQWIGTMHHDRICRIGEFRDSLNTAIDAYDEPFADNSLVPTLELTKFTSGYVKVALSGDGADEVFAGYLTYKADKLHAYAKIIPVQIRMRLLDFITSFPGSPKNKIGLRYKQKQFLYGSLFSPEKAHYCWRLIFNPEERVNILGEKYRELVYDTDPYLIFERHYLHVRDLHWLDRNLYVDAMTWLADDILVKVDRASMNNSIEVRCPYLDVDLVSFSASIPAEFKMKNFITKYILKKSLQNILPRFILKKRKSGFNAPVGKWIGYDGIDEFQAFTKYVFQRKLNHAAA